jgi:hypothetical protein
MSDVRRGGRGRLVLGIALVLVGLFATVAGVAIVVLVGPDGSVGLAPTRLLSSGVALTLPQLDVPSLPAHQRVDLDVQTAPGKVPLFVGIGRSAAVDAYLRHAPIDVIEQIDWPGAARTETVPGTATPAPPAGQSFWVVHDQGTAPQLHWRAEPGDWTLVVMRADAQTSIDVTLSGRVTIRALGPLGVAVLLLAVVVLGLGVWITVRAQKARG